CTIVPIAPSSTTMRWAMVSLRRSIDDIGPGYHRLVSITSQPDLSLRLCFPGTIAPDRGVVAGTVQRNGERVGSRFHSRYHRSHAAGAAVSHRQGPAMRAPGQVRIHEP